MCGVDLATWPQTIVCCAGALKFVSDNSSVVKSIASKQNMASLTQLLTAINKLVSHMNECYS
jgi:hypothetical protein